MLKVTSVVRGLERFSPARGSATNAVLLAVLAVIPVWSACDRSASTTVFDDRDDDAGLGGGGGSAGSPPVTADAGDLDGSVPYTPSGDASPDTVDGSAPGSGPSDGGRDAGPLITCGPGSGCELSQLCEEVCALHAYHRRS